LLAATAFSFFTWGRLLLCLLPAAGAITFAAIFQGAQTLERWPLVRKLTLGLAAALVLSLGAKTAFRRLPAFIDRHPYLEVATLRRIENSLPSGTRLGGTSPFLDRYLTHPYVAIPDAFGPELSEPGLYLVKLERLARTKRIAYLVVGAQDLRDRPTVLLGPQPPAPWLVAVERGPGVMVWRVR
jgi:hypothetical protein